MAFHLFYLKVTHYRGAWVTQFVGSLTLDFGPGQDLRVLG